MKEEAIMVDVQEMIAGKAEHHHIRVLRGEVEKTGEAIKTGEKNS